MYCVALNGKMCAVLCGAYGDEENNTPGINTDVFSVVMDDISHLL